MYVASDRAACSSISGVEVDAVELEVGVAVVAMDIDEQVVDGVVIDPDLQSVRCHTGDHLYHDLVGQFHPHSRRHVQ